LRSINPRLDRDLDTICARCLEREPEARYSSAAALAEDLERWLEGVPIVARPVSFPARGYRWSKRNPILAGVITVCVLLAGAMVVRQIQNWRLGQKIRETQLERNSIIVLPFLDLDNATQEPESTATLATALQAELSDIGIARIIPIKQVSNFKSAARNSQTRTALFGTLRKVDRTTRISIQLLTPDGDLLFNRIVDLGAEAKLESIAKVLAPELYSVLTAKDWREVLTSKADAAFRNPSAWQLIAAGREMTFHHTVRDCDRAISCFEKALELEPHSALAHAYLASAAAGRTHYVADTSLLARAQREVEEAERLAPDSAEVLRVLAGVRYQHGQFGDALEDALRAIETGTPTGKSAAMVGMLSRELGRPDKALRWYGLAKHFDSNAGEYDRGSGDCWALLGDYDKARTCYRRANDLHPERSEGFVGLSRLCLLNSDFSQARNLCQQSTLLNPGGVESAELAAQIEFFARNFDEAERIYTELDRKDPAGGGSFYANISYKSALGRMRLEKKAVRAGSTLLQQSLATELEQLRSVPGNRDTLYRIAALESSLGQIDSAVAHLESAVAAGWLDYRSLSLDPRFDSISNDTRFQTILGRLKLKAENLRQGIERNP